MPDALNHLIYFMPVIKFLLLYIISILKYQYCRVKSPWWGFNLSVPRLVTVPNVLSQTGWGRQSYRSDHLGNFNLGLLILVRCLIN